MMREPKWTIDEVLLGINAYFEIGDVRLITSTNPLIIELSQTLKRLPFYKNTDETFRNLSGVEMIIKTIASFDSKAKYSMKHFSLLQREVFTHYGEDKASLKKLCEAINACLPLPFEYKDNVVSPFQMIGNILYQYHLYVEEESQVAKILKRSSLERRKNLCQVCDEDLYNMYGETGPELLEQHYSEDISNYSRSMRILQGKFISVCPTCHKFAHSQPDLYIYDALKNKVNTERNRSV